MQQHPFFIRWACVVFLVHLGLHAQVGGGSIAGVVTDPQDAVHKSFVTTGAEIPILRSSDDPKT